VRRLSRRWSQAFDSVACERKTDNGHYLKKDKFRLDIRKNFFMMRTVKHWNRLLRKVMQVSILGGFQDQTEQSPQQLMLF